MWLFFDNIYSDYNGSMTISSSLQLNLFVSQPAPLMKEQLFSEEKRKQMQWLLSDADYNFYKEHTRFVSYEELLWKLAEMKDWLKKYSKSSAKYDNSFSE